MKFFAFIVAIGGWLATAAGADPRPLLPDRSFQAVILPVESVRGQRSLTNDFTDFWTPTAAEVGSAEKRMTEFFIAGAAKSSPSDFAKKTLANIREHPELFIRQYFGAIRDGDRVIVCNALPADMPKEFLERWREKYVRVFDHAGSWHIEYSLSKDKISWFFIDQGY